MSQSIGFGITFAVPCSSSSLLAAFESIRAAVAENWAESRDELSFLHPPLPVEPEAWVARCASLAGDSGVIRRSVTNRFQFSPLSIWAATIVASREDDGRLTLDFSLSDRVLIESDSDRLDWRRQAEPGFETPRFEGPDPSEPEYLDKMEKALDAWVRHDASGGRQPWATNRRAILRIYDRLRAAMPVALDSIDGTILEEPGA